MRHYLNSNLENSHCSQEQVEEYLAGNSSDGKLSALLSSLPIQEMCYLQDNETDFSKSFQSGMMLKHSMDDRGEDVLMWYQGDSLVRTYLPLEKERGSEGNEVDCGPSLQGSLAKYNPNTYSWKTRQCLLEGGLMSYSETFPKWGMMHDGQLFQHQTVALLTTEREYGSWPTTRVQMTRTPPMDRIGKESENYRSNLEEAIGGRPNPTWTEWLMGIPMMWTDLRPLETDKYRQWLDLHGIS
jgi:hypothetical protein